MNTALAVHLPKGQCINCGEVVVYVDEVEGGDWARRVRCDQMICPWTQLDSVITADRLEAIGMTMVEGACSSCGSGGCSGCAL